LLPTIQPTQTEITKATTSSSKVGGSIAFRFHTATRNEIGGFDMDVLGLVPDQKVRWPAAWPPTIRALAPFSDS
jgi:hypothetical protein